MTEGKAAYPPGQKPMEDWTLTPTDATVVVACRFCDYQFVRWQNETIGNIITDAAQHEC